MKDLVAKFIFSALHNLFRAQPNLSKFVPQETHEREPNLSFHLANELWKYLFWLDCDFDVTKPPHRDKRPDVIFHKRGSNALNFLVIEVKRDSNPDGVKEDIRKIKEHWFAGELQYDFGASVLLDEVTRDFEIQLMDRANPEDKLLVKTSDFRQALSAPTCERPERKIIDNVVNCILATEERDHRTDTSWMKQEIDRHVYALYGLTPEEIQIVEESSH